MPLKALKATAAMHLKEEKAGVLAIGHGKDMVSTYDNPQLYPMMFPWLFPYGLGGVGGIHDQELSMSDTVHKRRLMMYHDKRFQLDPHFALIAFNHEQIKKGTKGGFLMTDKVNFKDVVDRLMRLDTGVLEDLAKRLSNGERVKPANEQEKLCFDVLSDLDHVGGHVQGSLTSKKYMRSEIWSLISYLGAPSWFITFAPADVRHPICLYYANTKETFSPEMPASDVCDRLIANNPVAGARFFHFVVQLFIKHVLGVDQNHDGLYGETAGYYGTVEQQGRLTLHLHLLLWIKGSPTPQEIRDKIIDPNSDFQRRMVEYLESLCVGQFLQGTKPEVIDRVHETETQDGYEKPVHLLPDAPPPACDKLCDRCQCEQKRRNWWQNYAHTVDDILLRCNQHHHDTKNERKYCLDAKGRCKRRFPRQTFEETTVDPETGALNLKKGEANMNTVTPTLSYLLRCNSDVTSLLSGTAIKAVVAYVTDYITKQSLKTYTVFDVIRSIYDRNTEVLGSDIGRGEKTRKILTQVTNALSAKMEIGAPMASMYLLGNPDHYTSHTFVPFYWKSFVKEARGVWEHERDKDVPDLEMTKNKVVIDKQQERLVGISKVQDYVYRPETSEAIAISAWSSTLASI
ncbi:hypothetical protein HWV62_3250 [Athelia sp. TMB]|nr:hypothetical protein HWV62_3250 [Athelia sp. TMB]